MAFSLTHVERKDLSALRASALWDVHGFLAVLHEHQQEVAADWRAQDIYGRDDEELATWLLERRVALATAKSVCDRCFSLHIELEAECSRRGIRNFPAFF